MSVDRAPPKPASRRLVEWLAASIHGNGRNAADGAASDQTPSKLDASISVICISDTHTTRPVLPDGDLVLHAGDLSIRGTFEEVQAQLDWLNEQPHAFKVVIGGNHDYVLDQEANEKYRQRPKDPPLQGRRKADLRWGDVIYLDRTSVEITIRGRKIKIFGSPMTPRFGKWPFQYHPETDIWSHKIPDDTDIVMTHGPPRGYLDPGRFNNAAGCPFLLQELRRVQPRLHVFGHVHEGRGQKFLSCSPADVAYDSVKEGDQGWTGLSHLLRAKLLGQGSASSGQILLVNAAVVQQVPYVEALAPIVVNI